MFFYKKFVIVCSSVVWRERNNITFPFHSSAPSGYNDSYFSALYRQQQQYYQPRTQATRVPRCSLTRLLHSIKALTAKHKHHGRTTLFALTGKPRSESPTREFLLLPNSFCQSNRACVFVVLVFTPQHRPDFSNRPKWHLVSSPNVAHTKFHTHHRIRSDAVTWKARAENLVHTRNTTVLLWWERLAASLFHNDARHAQYYGKSVKGTGITMSGERKKSINVWDKMKFFKSFTSMEYQESFTWS